MVKPAVELADAGKVVGLPRYAERDPRFRWPPTAVRAGVDLPTGAVIGISLAVYAVGYLAWTLVVGRPFSVVGWEWDPTASAVTRQLIETAAIQLTLWIGIILLLGWRRSVGLVSGSVSLWGIVPLALFWAAALAAAGLSDVISKGGGFILLAVLGMFLAALNEEIAFRGFLFHGLTRRLGGTIAVLLGSTLFAFAHLPVELGRHHPASVIVVVLIVHFCSGVVLCRIRAATGSIWIPTGVHTLYNLTTVAFAIWAYPAIEVPAPFTLLKLGYVVTGLVLAIGLVSRRQRRELRAILAALSLAHTSDPTALATDPGLDPGTGEAAALPEHIGEPSRSSPFARFTGPARATVVLAQEEARRQRDPEIGTEHLLLALLSDRDGIAAATLQSLGVDLRPTMGPAEGPTLTEDASSRPHIPLAPRARIALAVAIREADRLGDAEIGPEHLLLGAVADRNGGAARVLRRVGVSPKRVRGVVLERIAGAPTLARAQTVRRRT